MQQVKVTTGNKVCYTFICIGFAILVAAILIGIIFAIIYGETDVCETNKDSCTKVGLAVCMLLVSGLVIVVGAAIVNSFI